MRMTLNSRYAPPVRVSSTTSTFRPLPHLGLLRDRNAMSSALIGVFPGMILSGSPYVAHKFPRKIVTRSLSATQTGQIMCVCALCPVPIDPTGPVAMKP
jgi:hypothetical protein